MRLSLLKVVGGFLAISAIILVAFILFVQVREWQFERAVAAASDWNAVEWETGEAIQITLRLTHEMDGASEVREETLTCHRKQLVEWTWRGPTKRMSYQLAVGSPTLAVFHSQRRYEVRPGSRMCRDAFKDGSGLKIVPEITILDLSETDANSDTAADGLQLRALAQHECRVIFDQTQSIQMTRQFTIMGLDTVSVEPVPLRSVISSAENLGSARAAVDRFARRVVDPKPPFQITWSFDDQCWMNEGGDRCITEADDACGFPKLVGDPG